MLFFSSLDQTLDKVRHSTYLIQYGSEVWIFQILGHSADEDITIRVNKHCIGNLHSPIWYYYYIFCLFWLKFQRSYNLIQPCVYYNTHLFENQINFKIKTNSNFEFVFNQHLNSNFATRKYIKYSKFGRILTDHLVEQTSYISEEWYNHNHIHIILWLLIRQLLRCTLTKLCISVDNGR